jgi:hypothetical protein
MVLLQRARKTELRPRTDCLFDSEDTLDEDSNIQIAKTKQLTDEYKHGEADDEVQKYEHDDAETNACTVEHDVHRPKVEMREKVIHVPETGAAVHYQGPNIDVDNAAVVNQVHQEQVAAGAVTQNTVHIPTHSVQEHVVEIPETQVVERVVEVPQVHQRTVEHIVHRSVEHAVHVPAPFFKKK